MTEDDERPRATGIFDGQDMETRHISPSEGLDLEEIPRLWRRDGSDEAFAKLEARYRKLVWSVCRRILLDPAQADEATQTTFVKMWLGRESFIADRPFWPWLRAIAAKTCTDQWRVSARLHEVPLEASETSRDKELPLLDVLPGEKRGPDQHAAMLELKQGFQECWRLLPGRQRALLQVIDWSDWKKSCDEIAVLEAKRAAVRVATIRSAKTLLACLRGHGFRPSASELLDVLEEKDSLIGDSHE